MVHRQRLRHQLAVKHSYQYLPLLMKELGELPLESPTKHTGEVHGISAIKLVPSNWCHQIGALGQAHVAHPLLVGSFFDHRPKYCTCIFIYINLTACWQFAGMRPCQFYLDSPTNDTHNVPGNATHTSMESFSQYAQCTGGTKVASTHDIIVDEHLQLRSDHAAV